MTKERSFAAPVILTCNEELFISLSKSYILLSCSSDRYNNTSPLAGPTIVNPKTYYRLKIPLVASFMICIQRQSQKYDHVQLFVVHSLLFCYSSNLLQQHYVVLVLEDAVREVLVVER
jgi:hypothetical protein